MRDPDEFPITGIADTTVRLIDFGFPATQINFVNDGAVSILVSFVSAEAAGFEVKPGESRSYDNTASKAGRRYMWVKTATSSAALHGEALR